MIELKGVQVASVVKRIELFNFSQLTQNYMTGWRLNTISVHSQAVYIVHHHQYIYTCCTAPTNYSYEHTSFLCTHMNVYRVRLSVYHTMCRTVQMGKNTDNHLSHPNMLNRQNTDLMHSRQRLKSDGVNYLLRVKMIWLTLSTICANKTGRTLTLVMIDLV